MYNHVRSSRPYLDNLVKAFNLEQLKSNQSYLHGFSLHGLIFVFPNSSTKFNYNHVSQICILFFPSCFGNMFFEMVQVISTIITYVIFASLFFCILQRIFSNCSIDYYYNNISLICIVIVLHPSTWVFSKCSSDYC